MKLLLNIFLAISLAIFYLPATKASPSLNNRNENKFNDRIYFGGNIGLMFGDYTLIGIYPLVGYKFTQKLSCGTKISYEYIHDKRYSTTYETSTYGGSLFSRYRIIPQIYTHVEFAEMNYELFYTFESKREWVPFLFVGAGISQPIGRNSWMNIQVLFDILQDEHSPYKKGEPFYSVGFGIGF